jgi:hypothetical protein
MFLMSLSQHGATCRRGVKKISFKITGPAIKVPVITLREAQPVTVECDVQHHHSARRYGGASCAAARVA